MQRWGKMVVAFLLIALQVFLGVTLGYTAQTLFDDKNRLVFEEEIHVMGVNVQGLNRGEIFKHIKYQTKGIPARLIFTDNEKTYLFNMDETNLQYDIEQIVEHLFAHKQVPDPLPYSYDRDRVAGWLNELSLSLDEAPVNARLVQDGEDYRIRESRNGRRLNVENTLRELDEAIGSFQLVEQQTIPLVFEDVTPEIRTSDIEKMTVLLGQSVTRFGMEKESRVHNLKLAAQSLHAIIPPEGEISFQERVGPFTEERGYREANVLINAEIEQGIGGGVCQLSSTFYHAGLKSMMEVIEHHPHSIPVNYIPMGMDATVDNEHRDLILRNPLHVPVYVQSDVNDGKLTVSFFTDQSYILKNVTLSTSDVEVIPGEIAFTPSSEVEKGKPIWDKKGRNGYRIKIWRIVYEGEEIERSLINEITYPKVDDVILHHPDESPEVLKEWKEKIEKERRNNTAAELG